MEAVRELSPAIVLLVVGILSIVLMRPLRLSPIVGFLLAGVLIGPHGFGIIQENATTHLLAELGVVFLLFDIGLHFSLAHIWDARRDILGLGPLQVIVCTAAVAGLAIIAGFELDSAIVIGATLALSSTAVAVQTLAERGLQNCPIGVTATAVLIFQDICAIFLLILATSVGDASVSPGSAILVAVVKSVLAFAAAIVIGRFLIGPLFLSLVKVKSEEAFTATGLLIVLLAAAATGALGLSLTLGAFLAGMMISETPYRYVIQTEVKPFRALLMSFFFLSVGMTLDTGVLAREWAQVLLIVGLLVALKTILVAATATVLRVPVRTALQLGFLLSQGSEFAFVIFGMPALSDALGAELSAVLIAAVAGSLALTPTLVDVGHRAAVSLANRMWEFQCGSGAEAVKLQPVAPVVIFGMGEKGRRVSDALEAHGIQYMAIEFDQERFVNANADGYPVAFGDVGDPRLMESIQMSQRPTIVITIKRYEISRDLTPVLRDRYPKLTRFIAVHDSEDQQRYEALGMRAVIQRSFPPGLDLAAEVLRAHGIPDDKILAWMRQQQDQALVADAAMRDAKEAV